MLIHEGKPTVILVFRRPAKGSAMSPAQVDEYHSVLPALAARMHGTRRTPRCGRG